MKALWSLDGLKAEALAGPASVARDSILGVGTDDELHGGTWRPLLQHPTR